MEGTIKDMVQCSSCHRYAPKEDLHCSNCGNLLPKGVAERKKSSRELPKERQAELAAYERFKQEVAYVPRWMRKLVLAFKRAEEDSNIHRLVQWSSGALGFFLAFAAAGPLVHLVPLPAKVAAKLNLWLFLQFSVAVLAFILASLFVFAIFRNIVEAMVQVFGDEEDALILQGLTTEKYRQSFKDR